MGNAVEQLEHKLVADGRVPDLADLALLVELAGRVQRRTRVEGVVVIAAVREGPEHRVPERFVREAVEVLYLLRRRALPAERDRVSVSLGCWYMGAAKLAK